ncbi:hypothetical protein ACJD0Z_07075 [Flavobacteriaceae bacterium M23B6Z8]
MKKIFTAAIAACLVIACNVEQKKEGELPEIDVEVDTEAGKLPSYEVDWADVNVGTTTKTVEIPKVVIVMEEEEVEVPYIDVDMPESGEKEERTLMIEAEVTGKEHALDIKEIGASQNNLYIIAMLEANETDLGDKTLRVSDQVTLNAPDLNEKYFIIGERPDRVFNSKYKYFATMDDLKAKLGDYTVIYKD